MPKPIAVVKLDICKPEKCSPEKGVCATVMACSHHIMEQEDIFDPPILFHTDMCQGCGDCARACPLDAILMA